jgi:CRP-like cAMP-binding protein
MEQLLGQPDTPPANGELATIPSDDATVVAAVPAGEMGAGGSPIATSPPKADGTLDAASSATTSSSSSPSATAKSDPASTVPAPAPKERVTSFAPSASAPVAAADGGARASASADAPAVSMGAARVTILFASKLKRKAKATRARRRAVFVNLIDGAMDRSTVAQAASDEEDAAEMTVVASNFASSNHEEDECPLTEGELERVLAALPELTKLPPKLKHLVLLQLAANKRKFRAKQSVLMRGSELKVCYVVMSGEFASFCREIDPQMNFANAHYGEGMAICEVALVKGGGSPVNIKCTEDGELLCLSGTAYRAILEHTVEAERSVDGGHEHFLQTLGCCAGIPQPALEQIASDASLRVLESRDAVTEAFSAGHSGSIFILKAGSAKVVLPRPELEADQTRKGAGKTITFKPGDLLGSTALAALTSAATIARRARSGSFAEAILSIDGESLQMGGGGRWRRQERWRGAARAQSRRGLHGGLPPVDHQGGRPLLCPQGRTVDRRLPPILVR